MATLKTSSSASKRPAKAIPAADVSKAPSALIDARIEELQDWRAETLSRLRNLIRSADPGVTEDWKWNVPVWSCNGILCTGETYRKAVKLTFATGASLADPSKLFNSSLEGNVRRAIDFPEGAEINETALKALVQCAIKLNTGSHTGKLRSE
jgi:hypothetical protein